MAARKVQPMRSAIQGLCSQGIENFTSEEAVRVKAERYDHRQGIGNNVMDQGY